MKKEAMNLGKNKEGCMGGGVEGGKERGNDVILLQGERGVIA